MSVRIRPADATDAAFLARVLVVAESWRDESGQTVDAAQHEAVWHYIAGWPRDDDFGVVAEDVAAEGKTPIGAAWARFFPRDLPGYGFIDESTPEIAIGVSPTHRGQGIGRQLLDALIDQARQRGLAAISLNVEDGNIRAQKLYTACGFVVVEHLDDSCTMLLALTD